MDGGAWWAAVHGVARSQTRLSDFTFTFHFHALEKEMATHSSTLAWKVPGTAEPGGLPSMGSHRVGHDWSDLAAAVNNKSEKIATQRCTCEASEFTFNHQEDKPLHHRVCEVPGTKVWRLRNIQQTVNDATGTGYSQNHSAPATPQILDLFLHPMCDILTQGRKKQAASCVYLMNVPEHKISLVLFISEK